MFNSKVTGEKLQAEIKVLGRSGGNVAKLRGGYPCKICFFESSLLIRYDIISLIISVVKVFDQTKSLSLS